MWFDQDNLCPQVGGSILIQEFSTHSLQVQLNRDSTYSLRNQDTNK